LGKESRFKEELDISAPKRNSMLNFLGYGIKKNMDGLEQSDGSCDERISSADMKRPLTVKKYNEKLESRKNGLGRKRKDTILNSEQVSDTQSPEDVDERSPTTSLTKGKRLLWRQNPGQESPEDLKTTSKAINSLSNRKDAIGLMAKAIKATEAERSQFLLPEHKEQASHAIIRQRSASFCRTRLGLNDPPDLVLLKSPVGRSHSDSYLTPEFSTPEFSSQAAAPFSRGRFLSVAVDPTEYIPQSPSRDPSNVISSGQSVTSNASEIPKAPSPGTPISRRSIIEDLDDTGDPLGTWSRYPSHTRVQRSGSAGANDSVIARDFAYDINPALIVDETGSADEAMGNGMIGKKKRRNGTNTTLAKGKKFIQHYGRFFRSTSLEYLRHGHGHRSSVAAGGELEHPELELLAGSPPIWNTVPEEDPFSLREDSTQNENSVITPVGVEDESELMSSANSHTLMTPNLETAASPISLDGSSELRDLEHQPLAKAGPTSSVDLHHSDYSVMDDTTMWSETNQPSIILPPQDRPVTEDLIKDLKLADQLDRLKDSMFSQANKSEDLKQPNMSSRITPKAPRCSTDYLDALSVPRLRASMSSEVSISNSLPSRMRHGHRKNESVTSIRASSYDLLQMLVEAEERERRKALGLDAVKGQARVEVS
jgi:hypothetical protein